MRADTGFPELDEVLTWLVGEVSRVLGTDLVGVYLVGSFALGDADEHSDVDVLVPVARPLTVAQETAVRAVHAGLPVPEGHWNRELEGSYPPVAELRTTAGLGRRWLYVDRGATAVEESTHCNTLEHRWTLRHRGVALTGPPPSSVVDELPPGALREDMRRQVAGALDGMRTWVDIERVAWGQRYAVATLCRMLFSLVTDGVASKRASMLWAAEELSPEWRPLIEASLAGRALGWDPDDAPTPEAVEGTERFARYAASRAQQLCTRL